MQQEHHGSPWAHGLMVMGVRCEGQSRKAHACLTFLGIKGVLGRKENKTYSYLAKTKPSSGLLH